MKVSPKERLLAECREEMRAYLKSLPEPISTPDLVKNLLTRAEQQGKATSSIEYGDSRFLFMTRREAYSVLVWSLRERGEIATHNKTWMQCWRENVSESDRENWSWGEGWY